MSSLYWIKLSLIKRITSINDSTSLAEDCSEKHKHCFEVLVNAQIHIERLARTARSTPAAIFELVTSLIFGKIEVPFFGKALNPNFTKILSGHLQCYPISLCRLLLLMKGLMS